ncbi:unnamed protein product [Caenorhabditis brenneri]
MLRRRSSLVRPMILNRSPKELLLQQEWGRMEMVWEAKLLKIVNNCDARGCDDFEY